LTIGAQGIERVALGTPAGSSHVGDNAAENVIENRVYDPVIPSGLTFRFRASILSGTILSSMSELDWQ